MSSLYNVCVLTSSPYDTSHTELGLTRATALACVSFCGKSPAKSNFRWEDLFLDYRYSPSWRRATAGTQGRNSDAQTEVCVGICVQKYRCPRRPEASDPTRAGAIGSCEPPNVGGIIHSRSLSSGDSSLYQVDTEATCDSDLILT